MILLGLLSVGLLGGNALADLPANPDVELNCSDLPENFSCPSANQLGGTYTAAIIARPSTLNPITSSDTASLAINDRIFGQFGADYGYVGFPGDEQIAEAVEISADGKTVTYTLRNGIHFGKLDGSAEPITMEDVRYTLFQLVFNENLPNSSADALRCPDGTPYTEGFKILSDTKFSVTCPTTSLTFGRGDDTGFIPVMSKNMVTELSAAQGIALGSNGEPTAEFLGLEVGADPKLRALIRATGPFLLSDFDPTSLAQYTRNAHFYQADSNGTQQPYLSGYRIIIIPTAGFNLALQQFRNGDTDAYGARPEDIAVLLSDRAAGRLPVNEDIDSGLPAGGTTQFVWGSFAATDTNPAWIAAANRSTEFRQALSLATDRRTGYLNILLGIGTPQYGISPPRGSLFFGRINIPAGQPTGIGNETGVGCAQFSAAGIACTDDGSTVRITSLGLNARFLPPAGAANSHAADLLRAIDDFDGAIAKANQILDSIQLVDTDGDGIRNVTNAFLKAQGATDAQIGTLPGENDRELEFELLTNAGNTIREEEIKLYCSDWRTIGLNCKPTPIDFAAFVDRLFTGDLSFGRIGLAGGNEPTGFSNVAVCGTELHVWHITCDPSLPPSKHGLDNPNAPTPDDLATGAFWTQGNQATTVEEQAAAFDKWQSAALNGEYLIHTILPNGLFAFRTDRIANHGRATIDNDDVKFCPDPNRCD